MEVSVSESFLKRFSAVSIRSCFCLLAIDFTTPKINPAIATYGIDFNKKPPSRVAVAAFADKPVSPAAATASFFTVDDVIACFEAEAATWGVYCCLIISS